MRACGGISWRNGMAWHVTMAASINKHAVMPCDIIVSGVVAWAWRHQRIESAGGSSMAKLETWQRSQRGASVTAA